MAHCLISPTNQRQPLPSLETLAEMFVTGAGSSNTSRQQPDTVKSWISHYLDLLYSINIGLNMMILLSSYLSQSHGVRDGCWEVQESLRGIWGRYPLRQGRAYIYNTRKEIVKHRTDLVRSIITSHHSRSPDGVSMMDNGWAAARADHCYTEVPSGAVTCHTLVTLSRVTCHTSHVRPAPAPGTYWLSRSGPLRRPRRRKHVAVAGPRPASVTLSVWHITRDAVSRARPAWYNFNVHIIITALPGLCSPVHPLSRLHTDFTRTYKRKKCRMCLFIFLLHFKTNKGSS